MDTTRQPSCGVQRTWQLVSIPSSTAATLAALSSVVTTLPIPLSHTAAEVQHDSRLVARLREEHLTGQRIRDRQPLERALQRGELPAGTDLDTLVDRLVGPLYYRALVTGEEITEDFVARLVGATLTSA